MLWSDFAWALATDLGEGCQVLNEANRLREQGGGWPGSNGSRVEAFDELHPGQRHLVDLRPARGAVSAYCQAARLARKAVRVAVAVHVRHCIKARWTASTCTRAVPKMDNSIHA